MTLLFNDSDSPFYNFVHTVDFPDLDEGFIEFLVDKLDELHGRKVPQRKLMEAFEALDKTPYWLMKMIGYLVTYKTNLDQALTYTLELLEIAEGFEQIAKKLKPIDKIVYIEISNGRNPFSNELLERIDSETNVKGISPNVQRSLKRLMTQSLVGQIKKGEYFIEKPGLKRFLS